MIQGVTPFRMQVFCAIAQHHDPKDAQSWADSTYLSKVMNKPRGFIVKAGAELVEGGLAKRYIDSFRLTVKGRQTYEAIKDIFVKKPSCGPVRPLAEILRGEP